MPTWRKKNPNHQPLMCNAAAHLWQHGLALAIYLKAGELTRGGEEPRVFNTRREVLSKFFDASYNGICKAMKILVNNGWLVPTEKKGHYLFVKHAQWAEKHPGKCVDRDLLPYQADADPFISKLFAIAQGSLRLKGDYIIASLRKLASDEEILAMFTEQRKIDIARRKSGDSMYTAPNHSLFTVREKLKARQASEKQEEELASVDDF